MDFHYSSPKIELVFEINISPKNTSLANAMFLQYKFVAAMLQAGLFFRHFFGKTVKRLAEILSQMKILTELGAEMGEL